MTGTEKRRLFIGRYTEGDDSAASGPTGPEDDGVEFAAPGSAAPAAETVRATPPGHGILVAEYDRATLDISLVGSIEAPEASYLALGPKGDILYAVQEEAEGRVAAFSIGTGGNALTRMGDVATDGAHPCQLTVHPSGRFLLTANFGSGSIAVHGIRPDGSLSPLLDLVQHTGHGPDDLRQAGPHAHMIQTDPSGELIMAADLGTDCVHSYTLDLESGRLSKLAQNRVGWGSGPRHLAFHPTAATVYVTNELSDTISACPYNRKTGMLKDVRDFRAAPRGTYTRNYPGGIIVSPDGRFSYWTNRGDDSIVAGPLADNGAHLGIGARWDCGGVWPRHVALSPDGSALFCANQRSDGITAFRVDAGTGRLTQRGAGLAVSQPAHVLAG
ncbi:MAG TPA: lactonase family protein [Actinocrinis sp.]|nr:lactonase family protein [Actinocrinis sp.]